MRGVHAAHLIARCSDDPRGAHPPGWGRGSSTGSGERELRLKGVLKRSETSLERVEEPVWRSRVTMGDLWNGYAAVGGRATFNTSKFVAFELSSDTQKRPSGPPLGMIIANVRLRAITETGPRYVFATAGIAYAVNLRPSVIPVIGVGAQSGKGVFDFRGEIQIFPGPRIHDHHKLRLMLSILAPLPW